MRVVGVPECGLFMDERHWDGAQGYTPSFQAVAQMQNVSRGVNAACTATAARGEEWKCFMAQYTLPHVETPYYIVNSFYDEWQWGAVLGMPWKTCGQPPKHSSPARPGCARTLPPACPLPARNALEQLRAHMIGNQSQNSNAHSSAFLYSCNTHCGQFSHDDRWGTLAVKSKSLRTSFTGWVYGGKGGLSPTLLHLDARKMVPAGGTKTDDETEFRADDQLSTLNGVSRSSSAVRQGKLYVDGRLFFGLGFYVHGSDTTGWECL